VIGLYVVGVVVVLALIIGGYRSRTDGRVREPRRGADAHPQERRLDTESLGADLGSEATFVQFSTRVCAPCRATHRLLSEFTSAANSGTDSSRLAHIDVDAETRLDLVREFGVTRTPTVLVLDPHGAVRQRIVGPPRRADIAEALQRLGGVSSVRA